MHISSQQGKINVIFSYLHILLKNITQTLLVCEKVILHFLEMYINFPCISSHFHRVSEHVYKTKRAHCERFKTDPANLPNRQIPQVIFLKIKKKEKKSQTLEVRHKRMKSMNINS